MVLLYSDKSIICRHLQLLQHLHNTFEESRFRSIDVNCINFFEIRTASVTKGHRYKIFKRRCSCTVKS